MENKEVILLDGWASMFGMRCRIALAEKGIEHEHREEDLMKKGELLLKANPIHKKVPVLIHGGKPICESAIIVEYIEEVWKDKAPVLLPSDPYERAQTRFWTDFIDKKIYSSGKTIWLGKGEELEAAKKEFLDSLKTLEEQALGDKPFFGGEEFGFLDLMLIPYYSWFHGYESYGAFRIEDSCPKLMEWVKRCLLKESVFNSMPPQQKVTAFMREIRDIMLLAQ